MFWHRATALGKTPWALALAALVLAGCAKDPDALTQSARESLDRRDPAAAILELKTALQERPDHAEARLLLGRALLAKGEAAGALVEFERANSLGLGFDRVAAGMGEAWLAQGRAAQVVDRLAAVQAQDPSDQADIKHVLALARLRLGETDLAQTELDAALRAAPNHGPARMLSLRLQAARGQGAAALQSTETLLTAHAGDPDLWVLKADLLRAGGRPAADVEGAYQRALDLQDDHIGAHAGLVGLAVQHKDLTRAALHVQRMLKSSKGNAQAKYLEASVALMQGNAQRAREVTQGLLRVAPDHPRVLFVAGLAELQLGAAAHAETLLTKAVMADSNAAEPRRALAEALLRLGRAQRAMDVLGPLTTPRTDDAKALALLAQAHLLQGDVRLADETFARAAKVAPQDTEVRTARAMAQLGRGKDDAAMAELGELARTQGDAQANYALVTSHLRRGELKQAQAAANDLAAKLPLQPMPDLLRGQIALRLKDPDAARRYFEWALGKDPRYLPALNLLVSMDMSEGKPDRARGRLVSHLQNHPNHVPAMLALADLLRRTGAPREEAQDWLDAAVKVNPIDPAARLAVVDHHLRGNDTRAALQAAQAADTALRDNPELIERLGRAQLRAGELNQATASFRRLLAMHPANPAPLLLLAQAQEAAGQAAAARQQIDEAIQLAPDAVPPRRAAVALALRQGQPARALELARAVQQRAPRDALGWALEGDVEVARQRWPAAASAYREALKRERPVDVPVRLHAALLRGGKADEAAAFEQAWRKAQPGDLSFVLAVADGAMARGDITGAEKRYRDVLAQWPEHPWALNNLAQMMVDQGKPGALDLARRAVAAAPDRADVRDTMAQAYAQADQMKLALQTQLEAVALAPEAPSLRLHLARLYLRTGDKDKALQEITWLKRQPAQVVKPDVVRELERQAAG